ncbi:thioesterase family protein [Rhizobium sp. L1K21]|uniref:acyl-CoA thioesterase n=1 Tax=Rhizobium sp. L1K21 TaxID=2954933 RepID=UPI00209272DC|nr:acyl-CoA thioesterase [Rhizobium sp. L1K21]MCO6188071.1 acyl-CoA thioesterase [Rhizobium sp. L1K21]
MITYKGVVSPQQCDVMGHMNVQHYIAAFDHASWHLVAAAGYRSAWLEERKLGWADRHYDVDFLDELPVGSLIEVRSKILKVGRTSLTLHHAMYNTETGGLCAEITIATILFDLVARKSAPLPQEMIDGAAKLLA